MKIVWRKWFDARDVETLTKMGMLPREVVEINVLPSDDGEDVARTIAEQCNSIDGEQFRTGGRITILEPSEFSGSYDISVDYEPVFYARKDDD